MTRSRTNSGFSNGNLSPLVLIAASLWIGALAAGTIGPWEALLAPLALLKPLRWAVVIAAIGAVLLVLRIHEVHQLPYESKASAPFVATLNSSFTPVRQRVIGSYLSAKEFSASATLTEVDGRSVHLPIRLISKRALTGITSQVVKGSGRVLPSSDQALGAILIADEITTLRSANLIQKLAAKFRVKFLAVASKFGGDAASLIPGMVLGETSLQSASFAQSMQRAGLTHLTAVSGENFAILALFILTLLKRLIPRHFHLRYLVLGCALVGFLVLVGPSPSVLRAAVMTSTLIIAKVRGVRSRSLHTLAFAVAILLVLNPFQAKSFGFALSVFATAGIILFGAPLERRMHQLIAIPLAATIACTPIIVLLSGQLSWSSLPANVIASIAVTPVTILGLFSALVAPLSQTIATALFGAAMPFAWWITEAAKFASSVTSLYLPKTLLGAAIPIVCALAIFTKRRWLLLTTILAIILTLITPHAVWPGKDWAVVNCDVGQGDGLVVRTGVHSAIVIDVGPDPELMDSCLKTLQIDQIPLLILTHFHADHVTGLPKVLLWRKVESAWVSHFQEPLTEYATVMKQLHGVHVAHVYPSELFKVGLVELEVLASGDGTGSKVASGSDINNSSIAVLIKTKKFSLFAGGDIEPEAQEAVLLSGLVQRVDLLKVSHHGSQNQYLPLLDALAPKIAFISVGEGNRYGHPSPVLLEELAHRHIKTYRTDKDGALAFDSLLHERSLKAQWWSINLK